MLKRLNKNLKPETLSCYLGLLEHGNSNKLKEKILLDKLNKQGKFDILKTYY